MDATNVINKNIAEALQLLEDAAKQTKDELKNVMSDKYANLRDTIVEAEHGFVHSLSKAKNQAVDAAVHAKEISIEKVQKLTGDVDACVRRNPWPTIGGLACVGLLLGYVLGRSRK